MLPVDQAEKLILDLVNPLDSLRDIEVVDLLAASGRILAQPVVSYLDFPHWDNSAMDGYAVRFADVQFCSPENPVGLEIVEEIPAGYQPQRSIQTGQAARILTGSVMPDGADTVVIQEETQRQGDRVIILSAPEAQAFVRHRATFYQAGATLLPAKIKLHAPEIAVLAAAQSAQVKVYRRPRVAILSTGNELVNINQPLQPGQIVDSNQYALAALITEMGAEPLMLGIIPDQPEALRRAIAQAIDTADIVLSSGGVSVGDYDYVDRILAELGATIQIRAVAIRPGKPLTVATFHCQHPTPNASQPVLYFGLPGNPVSALVTFWRFVQPALRKLSGLHQPWEPTFVRAKAQSSLPSGNKRESYLWGKLHLVNGVYEFELAAGSNSSGNLVNLAQTNGLAVISIGQASIAKGELIRVLRIN